MKQKSIFLKMLSMMMIALMSISFMSCGDDDDDENDANYIVGTWYGKDADYDEEDPYQDELSLTFNSDGTGTFCLKEWEYGKQDTENGKFTYVMDGSSQGYITATYSDGCVELSYFKIEGNKIGIYLYDEDEYEDEEELFEEINEDGYDWVLTKQ